MKMKRVEELFAEIGASGGQQEFANWGRKLEEAGDLHLAATAYDRAFGLDPTDTEIVAARERLLDRLSVEEQGILFRYIPAGPFLMGSDRGEPDERPVHEIWLSHYWLAETPLTLAQYCASLGGDKLHPSKTAFQLWSSYSLDESVKPPVYFVPPSDRHRRSIDKIFCDESWFFATKPMVAVGREIYLLANHLTTPEVLYRPSTEAEWEKAARGGLIGADYPWGDALPTPETCDFGLREFAIQPMRNYPPNGYKLYAMSGCVWELTADYYDAEYYRHSPRENPTGPKEGERRVIRGGSWADCAEAVRVSFRMTNLAQDSPNIGFRLCRVEQDIS